MKLYYCLVVFRCNRRTYVFIQIARKIHLRI